MPEVERWLRIYTIAGGIGLAMAAYGVSTLAARQRNFIWMTALALFGLTVLAVAATALYNIVKQLWDANAEAARNPTVMRDILRMMNQWRLLHDRWNDTSGAQRARIDPAVESLLERKQLADAQALAREKLRVAHASGEVDEERMYRRYLLVLDRMRNAA